MTRIRGPASGWAGWATIAVVGALAGHAVVLAIWPAAHTLLIDLEVYRAGGEHLLHGRPLYERGVLLDLPFVYPPVAAVLFAPLALLPVGVLKVAWTGLGLVLLGYVVRRAGQSLGVAGPGLTAGTAAVVALATWLDPVRTTLYLGQINIVLLALVLGDLLGTRAGRWRGVGLGIAAAVKLTPLLFVVFLLLVGGRRAAATAMVAFGAAGVLGFLLAPSDSVDYWLRGTFAAAGRISDVAAPSNHSVNGLVARTVGATPAGAGLYLAAAAVIVISTLVLAVRAHRAGQELLGLTLCGLCSAAVAPFAWSHHWVWIVPLVVVLAHLAAAGRRGAGVLLLGVLGATVAVVTALPGPGVGPVPSTGLISVVADTYVLLHLVVLAVVARLLRPVAARHEPS